MKRPPLASFLCATIAAVALTAGTNHGAIVVSILQAPSGPAVVGTPLTFTVNVRSDSGVINNILAIDFGINANDPLQGGNVTIGGQFSAGSSSFFAPGDWQFLSPFSPATSANVFSGFVTGSPLTITGTNTTVATLTLRTIGALPGGYTITTTDFSVADVDSNSIATIAASPFAYSLIALPEPEVATLLGAAGTVLLARRRHRGF